jgi:predicted hotdog family 3-hydroxylacyl-ACP dehydratase
MNPSFYRIEDLIPQRPPMVMIGILESAGDRKAGGRLIIDESNLFCVDGYFSEAGMMEFIAQTAAAWTGYQRLESGEETDMGYIGSVKNFVVSSLPAAGAEIVSEIVVDNELLGYTIITGKVFQGLQLLAECEMRIRLGNQI